jgi:hypothetical protein
VFFSNDTLYALDYQGKIFQQLPGSTDWSQVAQSGSSNPGKIFKVNGRFFNPFNNNFLYSDDGNTWQTLTPIGLPPGYITNMEGFDSVIIASVQNVGLYCSVDKGSHWWKFGSGLPNNGIVTKMEKANGKIYAVVPRYGIWHREIQISTATGLVFGDENQNGVQEANEVSLAGVKVHATLSDNLTTTDSNGFYQLYFDLPADTLKAILPIAYGTVQPSARYAQGIATSQDFGLWFQPDATDVSVFVTNTSAIRPGFDNQFVISVSNKGTDTSGFTLGLKLPPGIAFIAADSVPVAVLGDSIVWEIDALPFFGSINITVSVSIGTSLQLGQTVAVTSTATPSDTDLAPDDNTFTLTSIVVGSYDPNDKQVWPEFFITPTQIAEGQSLQYIIRFQNTGTYQAERVRIADTLDMRLDLASLQVIGASHPFTWRVTGGRVLEILFDHIILPDSNNNEAGSHGFFTFSIKGKPDLQLGETLHNRAYIYFDYNVPIITNTVVTEVSIPSGNNNLTNENLLQLKISPNPAQTHCSIELPDSGGTLAIFNAYGQLQQWISNCPAQQVGLETQNLSAGLYFLHWQKGGKRASKTLVILRP